MTQTQQRNDDKRTAWKKNMIKAPKIQHFYKYGMLKLSNASPPLGLNSVESFQPSWRTPASNSPSLLWKPAALMQEETTGMTSAKGSSLPPIHRSTSSRVLRCFTEQMGKRTSSFSADRAFIFSRQRQEYRVASAQLICTGRSVFSGKQKFLKQDSYRRWDEKSRDPSAEARVDGTVSERDLGGEKEPVTEVMETPRPSLPLDASAGEINSQPHDKERNESERTDKLEEEEEEDEEEEEKEKYFNNQRITLWIFRVNESLFSSSKKEISKQKLKEEDVDTKIVCGQD